MRIESAEYLELPKLADAIGAWHSGRRGEAELMARALVARDPGDVDAHRLLLEFLSSIDRFEEAIEIARRVISLAPSDAAAHRRAAELLSRGGDAAAAVGMLERSLELEPGNVRALNNLGTALTSMGRAEEAIQVLIRTIGAQPDYAAAFVNLGLAYVRTGRLEQAIDCYQRALTLNPRFPEAMLNLGSAYRRSGKPDAALDCYDRASALRRPDPDTLICRGEALLALERYDEALASFDGALQAARGLSLAHLGRAHALETLSRTAEAIDAYHEAMRLDPADPRAYLDGGQMMLRLGNGAAALAAFEAMLTVDPGHVAAKEGRAQALVALGRHEEALQALVELSACAPGLDYLPGYRFFAQLSCCEWGDFDSTARDIAARVGRGDRSAVPLCFLAHSTEPAEQRICAEVYSAHRCAVRAEAAVRLVRVERKRLRVGYLSADFRNHPVGQLSAGLIESHDRTQFETYGFCAAADDGSDVRRRLVAAFDHFEDISTVSDSAVAERIALLNIDVLIDLGGHTSGSRTRVLAYRPAGVQVSFLGFPGTLGAACVDYIIADRHVIPYGEQIHYAEQVIYMPDTYMPTDFPYVASSALGKGAAGLPDEAFVFCCFNSAFKFTPGVFDGWMRVLRAVPGAVLWLRDGPDTVKRNLAREAGARGVDAARLIYALRVPGVQEHLARFALADIFLDTTPYNAHTTAGEALAAGVPVISMRGRTFASRVATSLLHAVDLDHLSVDSQADYERLAVELAQSPTTLGALKTHLRRVRSSAPLFNTARFCRHFEDALRQAVARHRRGERPAALHVSAVRSER